MDEDDEVDESPMAFMFDAEKRKDEQEFVFESSLTGSFTISLKLIAGDPGHQQSGQYLWPASAFNARWVLSHPQSPFHVESSERDLTLLELGAGCGLTGLALSHLPCVKSVVLTDYDYGALELLKENATKCQSSMKGTKKEFITVEEMKWGSALSQALRSAVSLNNTDDVNDEALEGKTDRLLILGSDLIYCSSVCLPLFTTVRDILAVAPRNKNEGANAFFLVSSFALKDEIEEAAVQAYSSLGLIQTEINSLHVESGQCRCQLFHL